MRMLILMLAAVALAFGGAVAPVQADKTDKKGRKKDKTSAAAILAKQHGLDTGNLDASGKYQLSSAEQALNCKKLKGRMKVRILQVRDYQTRNKSTLAARALQSAVTPIFGGTSRGADPDAEHRKDLAMLEAYNQRLAEKNCKALDLKAELAVPARVTPPTLLPPSKPKTEAPKS